MDKDSRISAKKNQTVQNTTKSQQALLVAHK